MPSVVFKLPDLGEGLPDAEIVEWHVKVGDRIEKDQVLVSVETAKAVVEVPSPFEGKLAKAHGEAGDIIDVGKPLAEFEVDQPPVEETEDAGTVVGKMEKRSTVVKETIGTVGKDVAEVKATPAVRALAKRLNVELSVVKPSGPDGVITADDVKRVASVLAELGPIEPLRGVRRAMARSMSMAHEQVVPVTLHDDADIDHWSPEDDISSRLIRAIVAGCAVEPGLNAWYDNQAMGRRILDKVDLGVAVDTEDGLFVPVLKDVGSLNKEQIRQGLERIKAAVTSRDISPEELRGASFTLTNFGSMAGRYATPVVVPPAVAILGAGAIFQAVVPVEGKPVVHKVIPLSLTFDHRCITGGEAARFLHAAIESLQA
ncbi:MAG: dihydrolipoamide acetyltransferase family protein [Arenicellales bacterium]|nr:dihydrolipoamide acetyltransferase family protein [Arenicellales bacterium]